MERKEFENWLKQQSQETCTIIAARAALRAFPWANYYADQTKLRSFFTLLTIRTVLGAIISANIRDNATAESTASALKLARLEDIRFSKSTERGAFSLEIAYQALRAAHCAAFCATQNSPSGVSGFAASAIFALDGSPGIDNSYAFTQAATLDTSIPVENLWETPLWHRNMDGSVAFTPIGRGFDFTPDAPEWSYWREWIQGFLNGKPLDWELQKEIALIPDEDWEKGPEWIAGLIEGIRARFLAEKAPLAETMEFDHSDSKFYTRPIEVSAQDVFKATVERAQFAFSLALNSRNGLQSDAFEAAILNHTFQTCRDDPQTVEMNFMQVTGSLRRQMNSGEYPESPEILGLHDTLLQGGLDIRSTHSAVADAREKRAEQAVHEADDEQKAALADALPMLTLVSNEKLAQEFEIDTAQVLNTSVGVPSEGAPPVGSADATMRIAHRVAKMSILARSSDVAKAIEASGPLKAASVVLTLNELVAQFLKILGF